MIRIEQKGGDALKRIQKRAAKSWETRRRYDILLEEVYQYVAPYRTSGIHKSGEAQKLTNKLFDSTGPEAAVKFTGRMQQEVTPPFQSFFSLGAGPFLKRKQKNTKKLDEDLAEVSEQANAALTTSNFALASAEMYSDFFFGTGAMFMRAGDARQLIKNVAVPIGELALELGPDNDIWGRHWLKSFEAWMLEEQWPEGRFSDELEQQIRHEQDKPIEIMQSTVWNPKTQLHELSVFRSSKTPSGKKSEDEGTIWDEGFRASPWITPRFWSVPGEALGRGPGMLMLPFVKTLNKARELELQAAALALFGIWTAVDDDTFNTATARFKPGSFWKVASNGGGRGPSLQKLDVPGRFDLSRVVVQEEREQINRIGFNRQLPPDTGAVRSPTEIMARIRDLDVDLGGVYGRVALEIIYPVAQRAIDILATLNVLETNLTIDQLTVGLTVLSPIANSQKAAQAKKTVDYMQIVSSLLGPDTLALTMRLEEAVPRLGRDIGVAERDLRDADETANIQKMIVERAAQIMAAEQMKQLGPNGGPPLDEQPINGAAMQ